MSQRKNCGILCALACLVGLIVAPVNAEPKSIYFAQARASIYGIGLGIAGAVDVQSKPTQIEVVNSPSSPNRPLERRIYALPGMTVVNIKSPNMEGSLPLEVEIYDSVALRRISRELSELNRAAVVANLGAPDEEQGDTFTYRGLAESCTDTVRLGFHGDKLTTIRWQFCAE